MIRFLSRYGFRERVCVVPAGCFGEEVEGFAAVVCDADDAAEAAELLGEHALVYKVVFDDQDVQRFGDAFGTLELEKVGALGEAQQVGLYVGVLCGDASRVGGGAADGWTGTFRVADVFGCEGAEGR